MKLDLGRVKKLEKIIDAQSEERERYQRAEDLKLERQRTIDSAPDVTSTEFWCDICREDFIKMAHKIVITAYAEPIAFYEAKCPGGHVSRRRITDKTTDPYYHQSQALRKARKEMEIDLLQPNDPRFRKHWGNPLAKYEEGLELQEREEWAKRKNQ